MIPELNLIKTIVEQKSQKILVCTNLVKTFANFQANLNCKMFLLGNGDRSPIWQQCTYNPGCICSKSKYYLPGVQNVFVGKGEQVPNLARVYLPC